MIFAHGSPGQAKSPHGLVAQLLLQEFLIEGISVEILQRSGTGLQSSDVCACTFVNVT